MAVLKQTCCGMVDLVVREQFTNSCSKDLSTMLQQRYENLRQIFKVGESVFGNA